MKHNMRIRLSKKPDADALVNCRHVSIPERMLQFLFGKKTGVTIVVAGDRIGEIDISDEKKGEGTGKGTD